MVRAAKRAGIVAQVGYHMRFGVAVQHLKNLIDSGAAGKTVLFAARYECNALHGPWWRIKRKSGGQALEQAIHLYDMALYLFGRPVAVAGFTGNICHCAVPDYTVEDVSAATIRFASGALAGITATNCAVPERWNGTFSVVCEKVTAHFSSANTAEFIYTTGKVRTESIRGNDDLYELEDRAFIAAVRAGKARGPDVADGLTGLRVTSGVFESSRKNGAAVRI